jgi:hypothetical protein
MDERYTLNDGQIIIGQGSQSEVYKVIDSQDNNTK